MIPIIPGVHHCPHCPYHPKLKRVVWCSECTRIRTNKRHALAAKRRRHESQLASLHLELDDDLQARLKAWAKEHRQTRGEAVRVLLEHSLPEVTLGDRP
jgi:hypothetical protein